MKIALSVYNGICVGTAWCDIPAEHEGLSLEELAERYITPSFAAAMGRLGEEMEMRNAVEV